MRKLSARASGISRKKTVSKKTGIDRRNPLINSTKPARFSPKIPSSQRTTRSAAPLPSMHVPMIAASATTNPIPAAVLPKPSSDQFTASNMSLVASPGVSFRVTRLLNKPTFSVVIPGRSPAKSPVSTAAKISARNGCNFSLMIVNTMKPILIARMPSGQYETGSEARARIG